MIGHNSDLLFDFRSYFFATLLGFAPGTLGIVYAGSAGKVSTYKLYLLYDVYYMIRSLCVIQCRCICSICICIY